MERAADGAWYPQYPRFLEALREHTVDGQTMALVVPAKQWERGYSYAYYRASYFLAGREVLPIVGPDDRPIPENVARAPMLAAWHVNVRGGRPLWLFSGSVGGPQAGGHIALHVTSGNWKALNAMLGQPVDQSFTYDDGTIFLLWQGGTPTVIGPSQLKAGDRITVRIRAPRNSTLAQVEATPAARVGDHEPPPPPEE